MRALFLDSFAIKISVLIVGVHTPVYDAKDNSSCGNGRSLSIFLVVPTKIILPQKNVCFAYKMVILLVSSVLLLGLINCFLDAASISLCATRNGHENEGICFKESDFF